MPKDDLEWHNNHDPVEIQHCRIDETGSALRIFRMPDGSWTVRVQLSPIMGLPKLSDAQLAGEQIARRWRATIS